MMFGIPEMVNFLILYFEEYLGEVINFQNFKYLEEKEIINCQNCSHHNTRHGFISVSASKTNSPMIHEWISKLPKTRVWHISIIS